LIPSSKSNSSLRLFDRTAPSRLVSCLFVVSILGFSFGDVHSQAAPENTQRRSGIVHWVIDGDTFELETGERIRLIGIDAPEYQPWKGPVDAFGKEAAHFLKQLLDRQPVFLELDAEIKDKYGRTLAYVYLPSGEFVNLRLVREGLARVKPYPPNMRYYALLKNAQKKAQSEKRGVWVKRISRRNGLDNLALKR